MKCVLFMPNLIIQVWNSDVQFFHVKDANNKHIASFYLDPYSRPADKRGGAW
jgi:oligopeptidase A